MIEKLLYAMNAAEMHEDGNPDEWIIYVNRPGAYIVSQPLCTRPGCAHPIDHHSRSKGRCFHDKNHGCTCEAVSVPNSLKVPR